MSRYERDSRYWEQVSEGIGTILAGTPHVNTSGLVARSHRERAAWGGRNGYTDVGLIRERQQLRGISLGMAVVRHELVLGHELLASMGLTRMQVNPEKQVITRVGQEIVAADVRLDHPKFVDLIDAIQQRRDGPFSQAVVYTDPTDEHYELLIDEVIRGRQQRQGHAG